MKKKKTTDIIFYQSKKLQKNSTCAKFTQIAADRKTYQTQFYNLYAVIPSEEITT
jgi:hypothetical protein